MSLLSLGPSAAFSGMPGMHTQWEAHQEQFPDLQKQTEFFFFFKGTESSES